MNIVFLICIILVLVIILFTITIFHSLNSIRPTSPSDENLKDISIIIAARDEEDNISDLLNSLSKIEYPKDLYEIIIVDDNSTDRTYEIANNNAAKFTNLKVIKVKDKKYAGKKGALDVGIQNAKFNYIVTTDADCQVGKNWLLYFSTKFNNESKFVFGNIVYINLEKTFAGFFQQFENLRSKILYYSAANLNFPYSAGGANFGFEKSSFLKLGGYKNISSTLSGDDDLLIQQAAKMKYKIRFVIDNEATVFTNASQYFCDLIKRKARHTSASYYYSLKTKMILSVWHISNLAAVASLFLIPFDSLFILPFAVKLILDILIVAQYSGLFGYSFNFVQTIIYQLTYEFMIVINFFNGFNFINKWK